MVHGGITKEVLIGINDGLNDVIRPFLTSLPAFLIAIFAMLQYHFLPLRGISRWPLARVFGQSLIVLQLYCDPDMKNQYPFILSCGLVILDQVLIQNTVILHIEKTREDLRNNVKAALQRENISDEDESAPNVVQNKYMDVTEPLHRVALLFIGQIGLMCYFIYTLNDDEKSHDVQEINFVKWSLAVILTMVVDDDEAGVAYSKSFWSKDAAAVLYDKPEKLSERCLAANTIAKRMENLPTHTWISYKQEWKIRRMCDGFINAICRSIIMSTAPMLLCTEEPIDFIKDCLALFFIVKLDDLDDARTLNRVMQECSESYERDTGKPLPEAGTSNLLALSAPLNP